VRRADVRFIQTIEFSGDQETFERQLDRFRELIGDDTTVRRAVLCQDRDRPGTLVEFVEFDSYEDAVRNSEHPATRQWAEEASATFGSAVFRNLEVLGEYTA
jgi:hypothetical protein